MQPDREHVIACLRTEAAATPGLIAAYLFGSMAGDRATEARDIDVALAWERGVGAEERWHRGEALATAIEVACSRQVDLVDLGEAPLSLRHRVLVEGVRAFEGDPARRVRFEAETLSMALDFIEWQRPYLDRWLKRVARG